MRRRYVISGQVQGVGFRQFAAERARVLKISGWVRNLSDGSVEAQAASDAEPLAEFENFLRNGPRFGRVDQILTSDSEDSGELPAVFEVRH